MREQPSVSSLLFPLFFCCRTVIDLMCVDLVMSFGMPTLVFRVIVPAGVSDTSREVSSELHKTFDVLLQFCLQFGWNGVSEHSCLVSLVWWRSRRCS